MIRWASNVAPCKPQSNTVCAPEKEIQITSTIHERYDVYFVLRDNLVDKTVTADDQLA